MANVKLVIEIDEEWLKDIKERIDSGCVDHEPWVAIANGTPLPKGHGRLIAAQDENEPCEDCISRQAVLAIAGDSCLDLDSYEDTKEFCDEINELPPVTPKPKTGRWIEVTNGKGGHECDLCHEYAPSYKDGDERLTKYCPNCGANMEGDKR